MHQRLLAAAGVALIGLLSACAAAAEDGPPTAVSAAPAEITAPAEATAHNGADIRFSREMIPHHLQMIELAELVESRTTDPFVVETAEKVTAGANEELDQMTGWLKLWNVPPPTAEAHEGHSMPGMLTPGEIAMLEKSSGATFDRLWLRLVSRHLGHGVEMAERALATGRHTPTTMLAGKVVTAEREEIEQIGEHLRK
ncbi:DUF305 domain-containing protein [Streptosporangium soli]|nr:DUF305 domain-containing protein [Streptosporangium sp. KLBMP 9127]